MSWSKTKNVWSPDPADTIGEKNIQLTNMLGSTWGVSTPASSKEDAALHKILTEYQRNCMRQLGSSGFAVRGAFSFSGGYPANSFQAALSTAMVDGLSIKEVGTNLNSDSTSQYTLPAPPGSGTRNDLVFLEMFLVEVPGSTNAAPVSTNKPDTSHVFKWGNVLYGGTNIVDDINEASYEIRRRVQVQYRIRTVGGVNFGSHPNGIDDTSTVFAQGPQAAPTGLTYAVSPTDAGLYIAGNGSVAHQSTLGTLDGHVYAIPIAQVARTTSTTITSGNVTDLRNVWGGVITSGLLTTKGDLMVYGSALSRLGVGANGTQLEADSAQSLGAKWIIHPFQSGRLQYVSATQIKLTPYKGARIPVYTGGIWTLRTISSSGIAAANASVLINGASGNLAANTTYLVSLIDVSGTLTLAFWAVATGHGPDLTHGIEQITGQADVLIGLIQTNASSQFSNDLTTISWLNRILRSQTIAGIIGSTASGSYVAANNFCNFCNFAGDSVLAMMSGEVQNNTTACQAYADLAMDSTTVGLSTSPAHAYFSTGTWSLPASVQQTIRPGEGFHYIQPLIKQAGGGTATLDCDLNVFLLG